VDLAIFTSTEGVVALLTLTLMEVVLGIDTIGFLSILTGKLPPEQRGKAQTIGLALALVARLGLHLRRDGLLPAGGVARHALPEEAAAGPPAQRVRGVTGPAPLLRGGSREELQRRGH